MKLSREYNGSIQKASSYTQEGVAELAIINDLIDKMKITMKIKYMSVNKKKVLTFEENPRVNLIYQCHKKANKYYIKVEVGKKLNEFSYLGVYALKQNGVIADRTIIEKIRISDTLQSEMDYINNQLGSRAELVDLYIRRCYPGRISAVKIKIIASFNHHGK